MLKLDIRCERIVKRVAIQLKTVREKQRVSKNELSQRSGVSRAAIRRIENGERSPSIYILLLLTHSLNINLGELITEVEKCYQK